MMKIEVLPLSSPAFAAIGRVLLGYPTQGALELVKALPMTESMHYQARDELIHLAPSAKQCGDMFLGGLPFQMGYLTGRKTKLDALRFFRSAALYAGAEDYLLLAAHPSDIVDGKLDTANIRVFRVPAGVTIELYGCVPHALRRAEGTTGVRALVCLPYATGCPYRTNDQANFVDMCLWERNAWVLAHRFSPEAGAGAVPALEGDNWDTAEGGRPLPTSPLGF